MMLWNRSLDILADYPLDALENGFLTRLLVILFIFVYFKGVSTHWFSYSFFNIFQNDFPSSSRETFIGLKYYFFLCLDYFAAPRLSLRRLYIKN